jgi:outer membrane protein TolC
MDRARRRTPAVDVMNPRRILAGAFFAGVVPLVAAHPQASDSTSLDALVARALAANPALTARSARIDAARHRVAPAGARPDPMLMAGVQNFPISEPGFTDAMTMKMIGVSQTIPYPGKLSLRTKAADDEVVAARAELDEARLDVTRQVKDGFYELAFLDRAIDVIARNQAVLAQVVRIAGARYSAGGSGAGAGSIQEVLAARVEATKLADDASALHERRRGTLATLNVLLDRRGDTPVEHVVVPARIVRAAIADSARARFTSDALGTRAADSPLPPLDVVQQRAITGSPALRMHEARIAAQAARVELAAKSSRPDVDVSLQYGQRNGMSDMISAQVSIPIPVQKGRKQDEEIAAARSDLAALHAEHLASVNTLRAEVARRYGDVERARTQLALYARGLLPQARAALDAATAEYQVGRGELRAALDAQSTLFNYDTMYWRALSDFATSLAALDQLVGAEVLP